MKRFRFNIGGLMGVVALAAIGMGMLRDARAESLNILFLIALALDFAAVLTACLARARARAFAVGYLLIGCGYLALVALAPVLDKVVHDQLIAVRLIPDPQFFPGPRSIHYPLAAHSLLDVAAGLAGGLIALGLARVAEDPKASTEMTSSHP